MAKSILIYYMCGLFLNSGAASFARAPVLHAVTPYSRVQTNSAVSAIRGTAPAALATAATTSRVLTALGLNSGLAAVGVMKKQRILTPAGLLHAWALGVILWGSLGWRAWTVCVLYLVCGSKATKVRMSEKQALGIAEGRGGVRGPENVWGSAATAAACSLAAAFWPAHAAVFRIGFVASLATKLSDTCASEIGKAFGKTTYLITTMQRVPRGTEGAVSLEGTAAGVIGSVVLTAYAALVGLLDQPGDLIRSSLAIIAASFVATNCESVIGAVAQNKNAWLTNELVNFIMTVIGAACGIAFAVL